MKKHDIILEEDARAKAKKQSNDRLFWAKVAAVAAQVAYGITAIAKAIVKKIVPLLKNANASAASAAGALMVVNYVAAVAKDFVSIYKKGGQFRSVEKGINIGITVALILFAALTIAFPPLYAGLMVGVAVLTLALQTKHLAKMLFKNYAMRKRIQKLKDEQVNTAGLINEYTEMLNYHLSLAKESECDDEHEQSELEKYRETFIENTRQKINSLQWMQRTTQHEIHALEATVSLRRYKIARDVAAVSSAALVLIGVIIAFTTGPIGWSVVAAAVVIGIAVQIGIYLHRKKYACPKGETTVKLLKKSSDYDPTYKHTLSELTRDVTRDPKSGEPKHRSGYKQKMTTVQVPTDEEMLENKKVRFKNNLPTMFNKWNEEQQEKWDELEKTNVSFPVPKHIGCIEL